NTPPVIHTAGATFMLDVRRLIEQGQIVEAIALFQKSTGSTQDVATKVVSIIAERVRNPALVATAGPSFMQTAKTVQRVSTLGCLGVVAVMVLFMAGIIGLINVMFRTSDSFNAAMKLMNRNTQVQQALGTPVTPGLLIFGNLTSSGSSSRFNYNFPVYGPRGSAQATVNGTSDPTGVHMNVYLMYNSGSENVTLRLSEGK
ncbi:MAG TPA: cytochrome c oxidase assembly factor Coa1 family protein, partial [Anaerolineae bacterium]